jgi:radical SAM family RiPP maturation amino acid epimerase
MSQELLPSVRFMRDIYYTRRTEEQLKTISHIKRFMECLTGDPDFQKALKERPTESGATARERGLDIDPGQIKAAWSSAGCEGAKSENNESLPLAKMWADWIGELIKFRNMMREDGASALAGPRFNAWRKRQIARTESEQGRRTDSIVHSILSFELSKGCSVGCWFCGLAAEPFQGAFVHTPENAGLWRDILQVCVEKFGLAVQTGFCYWATEPTDNPDYLDFLRDFYEIAGALPQTTTAAPLKDPAWTRELLRMHRELPGVSSRFSIVSLKGLRQVHAEFSPEELVTHELVLQQKESIVTKSRTGRVLQFDKESKKLINGYKVTEDTGTIACVSGFLVSMMDRTIALISPSPASDRWPRGYRIYAQGTFRNAEDFASFIDDSTENCMPDRIAGNLIVAFRGDLHYSQATDGFTLTGSHRSYKLAGEPYVVTMGELIARGDVKASDLLGELIDAGGDIFSASATLQDLFDKGLLEEEPLIVSDKSLFRN